MAEGRPLVFISYSRVDSDFAYRLRADLEASGFTTWIDSAKLNDEGGQEWMRLIQDAVDNCQAMVVILSPDSIQSRYVHMEYHRAQTHDKLVVPLHYRTVTSAPIDLDLTQWLEFRADPGGVDTYQTGLTSLILSLSKAPTPPHYPDLSQAPAAAPLTISEGADIPIFRPVTPPPPTPPQELRMLMTAAYDARGEGDLASEQYYLQQIIAQDPSFPVGQFTQRLEEVTREIEALRLLRLRSLAQEAMQESQWRRALGSWQALLDVRPDDPEALAGARQARITRAQEAIHDGEYDEAIGTWQALLRSTPDDDTAQIGLRSTLRARADDAWNKADWTRAAESWETLRSLTPPESDAQEYLDAITQNQRGDLLYESAQRSLAAGNTEGARIALTDLYTNTAPNYGDPAGIASQAGVTSPSTLAEQQQERARQQRLEEERVAEERRLAEERQHAEQARLAAEAEQARQVESQRQAAVAEQQRVAAEKVARSRSRWSWHYVFTVALITQAFSLLPTTIVTGILAGRFFTGNTIIALFTGILSIGALWCMPAYGLVKLTWRLPHGVKSRSYSDGTVTESGDAVYAPPSLWKILAVMFSYILIPFSLLLEVGFADAAYMLSSGQINALAESQGNMLVGATFIGLGLSIVIAEVTRLA